MDDDDLFLVVGYHNNYSSVYKELLIYGAYKNLKEASERIESITGSKYNKTNNITNGRQYCLWVNNIHFGDLKISPNAGAYTSDFSMYPL